MNLKIHTYTNKGGKVNNEDYLNYYCNGGNGLFVLADGLGGHGNGDIAAKIVADSLCADLKNIEDLDSEALQFAFQNANSILIDQQEKLNLLHMKTTAVVLNIYKNKAIWAHLGDSRLYYFSDNALYAVTEDHSVTYKKFLAGEISYLEINQDEDRSSLLGVFGNKEKCSPQVISIPQIIKSGDAFLLCSDGFWEYVYNEEMLLDFLKSIAPKRWIDFMLLRHIRRTKPANDNYSAIAIFVE